MSVMVFAILVKAMFQLRANNKIPDAFTISTQKSEFKVELASGSAAFDLN